jgi:hypothetical protein
MARTNSVVRFQEIFEEHPVKSCIGCFFAGIAASYWLLTFLYEDKYQNLKDRYEDKIEQLNKAHEQDLQIKEITLKKEEGTKYYLNVDPNTKLGSDISKLINKYENEK